MACRHSVSNRSPATYTPSTLVPTSPLVTYMAEGTRKQAEFGFAEQTLPEICKPKGNVQSNLQQTLLAPWLMHAYSPFSLLAC